MLKGKRKFIIAIIAIVSVILLAVLAALPWTNEDGQNTINLAVMVIGGISGALLGVQGMVDKVKASVAK